MRRGGSGAAATVSVVIPTLDEAELLPVLLDSLCAQTRPPDEIIVADADSTDGTPAIARRHGALVVPGGPPARGRNRGAAASSGDLLVFLDADAQPRRDFLERALAEFTARGLDVATAPVVPLEPNCDYHAAYAVVGRFLRMMAHVSPHAVGAFLLVRRGTHRAIGGFDETLALGEDHDYARRASRAGRFGVLSGVRIPLSMRRVRDQGRLRYALVALRTELGILLHWPVRRVPDGYRLGGPDHPDGERPDSPGRLRRVLRMVDRPSTELQGRAIGVLALSLVVALGALPAWALWRTRRAGAVAAVALGTAAPMAWLARRKHRHERRYGRFFSATVATASDDVRDAEGHRLITAGVDRVCELHVIRGLREMSRLNRLGRAGRLGVRLEIIEGLLAFADRADDPAYRHVSHLTGRSHLARELLPLGFTEIDHPPHLDVFNRIEKQLLAWQIGWRTGRVRTMHPDADCMVVMPWSTWRAPRTRAALAAWAERTRADLAAASAADAAATRE